MSARRVLVFALCAWWAGAAAAQTPPPRQRPPDLRPLFNARIPAEPPSARRDLKPLTPEQLGRFREAQNLRSSGMLARARGILIALDKQVPHHPLVVTELAQVYLDQQNFAAVEKLGRS